MIQETLTSDPPERQQEPAEPLRVVLLADNRSIYRYGPVLRRIAVGLLDEVSELSLVCLQPNDQLNLLPSPPLRLITQSSDQCDPTSRYVARTHRQITLSKPLFPIIDDLLPGRRVKRLSDRLADYKPTLIHALDESHYWLARRLSKQLQVPYVVSMLTASRRPPGLSHKRCHGVFPCSTEAVRNVRQQHQALAKRVRLIPMGTHVSEQIAAFSRNRSTPWIMCCSEFKRGRGLIDLLHAIKSIEKNDVRPMLILSGKGSLERLIRREINKLELSSRVFVIPPINDIILTNDAYKMAFHEVDIFVQASPLTSWQPEFLEAASVGNAIVTAEGNLNDLVDEKTGITFKPGSRESLADALSYLMSNPQAARGLARNAQERLRKHFLASSMVESLVQAYRKALSER
jgi:glycosyltransferase involved in cell wall biosynthesis